jgi:hypothetical protein
MVVETQPDDSRLRNVLRLVTGAVRSLVGAKRADRTTTVTVGIRG